MTSHCHVYNHISILEITDLIEYNQRPVAVEFLLFCFVRSFRKKKFDFFSLIEYRKFCGGNDLTIFNQ